MIVLLLPFETNNAMTGIKCFILGKQQSAEAEMLMESTHILIDHSAYINSGMPISHACMHGSECRTEVV